METQIKFFYNGLKVNGGKLQKCHWSLIEEWTMPHGKYVPTQIVGYAPHCVSFSKEIWDLFTVKNETDYMTDYFEGDRLSVTIDHPMFKQAAEAALKSLYHKEKIYGPGACTNEIKKIKKLIA